MKKTNELTPTKSISLNMQWMGKSRRSAASINERAHSSSVASGRGKIADEALRKFSWESDSDPAE